MTIIVANLLSLSKAFTQKMNNCKFAISILSILILSPVFAAEQIDLLKKGFRTVEIIKDPGPIELDEKGADGSRVEAIMIRLTDEPDVPKNIVVEISNPTEVEIIRVERLKRVPDKTLDTGARKWEIKRLGPLSTPYKIPIDKDNYLDPIRIQMVGIDDLIKDGHRTVTLTFNIEDADANQRGNEKWTKQVLKVTNFDKETAIPWTLKPLEVNYEVGVRLEEEQKVAGSLNGVYSYFFLDEEDKYLAPFFGRWFFSLNVNTPSTSNSLNDAANRILQMKGLGNAGTGFEFFWAPSTEIAFWLGGDASFAYQNDQALFKEDDVSNQSRADNSKAVFSEEFKSGVFSPWMQIAVGPVVARFELSYFLVTDEIGDDIEFRIRQKIDERVVLNISAAWKLRDNRYLKIGYLISELNKKSIPDENGSRLEIGYVDQLVEFGSIR